MQAFKTACLILVATATVATEVQPSAAMVIYPWCANYGGGGKGGIRRRQLWIRLLSSVPGDA
jgi:hypothetical protein